MGVCDDCQGEGTIVTCCDDICNGIGYCIHGDGESICSACGGEGYVPDEDDYDLDEDLSQEWVCTCGHYQEDGFHCSCCGNEPPWGCDCSACDELNEGDADDWLIMWEQYPGDLLPGSLVEEDASNPK